MCNAAIIPAGYGIEDYCLSVIVFSADNITSTSCPMVVCITSQRLNTKIPRVAEEHVKILEEKVLRHRLIKQTGKAHWKNKPRALSTKCLNPFLPKGAFRGHFDFSGPFSPINGPINMIPSRKVVVDVLATHFCTLNHYDWTIIGDNMVPLRIGVVC